MTVEDCLPVEDCTFADSDISTYSDGSDEFCDTAADCIETNSLSNEEENKWRLFCLQLEDADEVAKKLNQLIRDRIIDKNHIFYKYLADIVNFFFDKNYTHDPDVVEFYNTVLYLGGRSTFNFIRGPMLYGTKSSKNTGAQTLKMNLGGPSLSTCLRQGTAYTTKSGVLKSLSSIQLGLMNQEATEGGKVKPIIDNERVAVFPCCYSNDGTALKPAVEYDSISKTNVGLTSPADYDFVKANTPPDPGLLKDMIITEAVVGSVTTLDNENSLPVLVEYVPKAGKTGVNLTQQITKHVKVLQMCEACTGKTKANDLILDDSSGCNSFCKDCYDAGSLCSNCMDEGQTSIYPALRACQKCVKDNLKCIKRAVLVLTTDCEEGNKQMFLAIKDKIQNKQIDPSLALLVLCRIRHTLEKALKHPIAIGI